MSTTTPSLQTGLTGRPVLLDRDDADAYEKHIQRFVAEFSPKGSRETELVQSLADTRWRLNRIPVLEAGIYAVGARELADLYPEETPAVRKALIQAKTFLTYTRQLNNLYTQEARLHRQYESDLQDLRKLQSDRKLDEIFEMAERAKAEMASYFQPRPRRSNKKAEPAANEPAAPAGDPQPL